jgi:hypothetical protein
VQAWIATACEQAKCATCNGIRSSLMLAASMSAEPSVERRASIRSALAFPLSYLAFLSLLALLSFMTLGAAIHVLGTVRARWPQWRGVEQAK